MVRYQSLSTMAAGISETGAQLFARLGAKPSLESLDPKLFPSSDFLRPGDAVEFYGSSGCGKTEMLLHIISKCILPKSWRGAELDGMGVGVILVDADFQFSMLRLFHILERRIVDMMEQMKEKSEQEEEVLDSSRDASAVSGGLSLDTSEQPTQNETQCCEICKQNQKLNDSRSINNIADLQAVQVGACLCNNPRRRSEEIGKKRTRSGEIKSDSGDASKSHRTEYVDSNCITRANAHFEVPTAEEIEAFIKSCLNRFYLVRSGGSSDQLIITLHSLESLIVNRPELSILMLENVAAFYWTDKMNGGVASAQEANQRKAATVIKRLIGEYQLVLFTTKPALTQRNRHVWKGDSDASATHQNHLHSDAACEHHEFMSNAWHKLITHRFIMRRHERLVQVQNRVLTRSYFSALRISPPSDQPCKFSITEKGVVHQ